MFSLTTLAGGRTAINPDHVVRVIAVPADGESPAGTVIFLTNGDRINTPAEFDTVVNAIAQGRV